MDPSSQPPKKSSIIPVIGAEGGIILVLVVLIAITFNYFNILPISKVIPILPHKDYKKDVAQIESSNNFGNGGKCQNLPKNISLDIQQPPSSVSAELAAYSGIWQGSWGGQVPSTLIVNNITPFSVHSIYVFHNSTQELSFKVSGKNISLAPFYWQMSKNGTLSGVYKTDASSAATFIEMKKCKI